MDVLKSKFALVVMEWSDVSKLLVTKCVYCVIICHGHRIQRGVGVSEYLTTYALLPRGPCMWRNLNEWMVLLHFPIEKERLQCLCDL